MTGGPAPLPPTPPTQRPRRRRPAVLRWLSAAEAVAGGLLLTLILALTLLQAAQRYLPDGGWVWTGELAQFGLVWLTFAMAGHLAARDGHVTLKLADVVAGPRLLRLIGIAANVTVAIVCLNLAYEAYDLVTDDTQQTSPALGMPLGLLYVIPLAGLLLTTVRAVVAVFLPEPETDDDNDADAAAGQAGRAAQAEREEPSS